MRRVSRVDYGHNSLGHLKLRKTTALILVNPKRKDRERIENNKKQQARETELMVS